MIISNIIIENFRGYKNKSKITLGDLTAFVGQNDSGKSTLLEALDIFFNDGKGVVKMDKSDININASSDEVVIGVCLKNFPEELVVDSSVTTSLKDEYLLNENGELEVHKVYINGSLKKTLLIAYYPDNPVCHGLHLKKNNELQEIVEAKGIVVSDKRKSSLMRKAIFSSIANPTFQRKEISIDKEGGKQIWAKLKEYLPIYELFQSDRKNEDQDDEIQDPMKLLIKELLQDAEISSKLEEVYNKVKLESELLAEKTLEKLSEMNPEIAKELKPDFKPPTWNSVFKFSLSSDQGVALNKRGSGVRRMILLNFFRAEAERRRTERNVPNIIYAFEEPETSQHPKHQKMLIDAFKELSEVDINQVILTTHSPAIAKMLPIESLRLINKDEDGEKFIEETGDYMLEMIAEHLGVLPDIELRKISNVEVAICVEGKNDINFLRNINSTIPELKEIVDLNDERIIIIPMGGSTLQFWVNDNYLGKLNLSQVHIYDSDIGSKQPNKYTKFVDIINEREKSVAFETQLREFENYITPDLLLEKYPGTINKDEYDWACEDIPTLLAKITHGSSSDTQTPWEDLKDKKKKDKAGRAKIQINETLVTELTKEHLVTNSYYDEISSWFQNIAKMLV